MTLVSQTDYQPLFALVQKKSGIQIDVHRQTDLSKIFDRMFETNEVTDVNQLATMIEDYSFKSEFWQRLLQVITIGETYFFRNQAHFDVLRNDLFPKMIAEYRKNSRKLLRIWCAGCATGEEPYSIAILLRDLIPDISDWSITILGTDINRTFLQRAKQGVYSARSFRGETPDWLQGRWFTPVGTNYQIDEVIRNMVQFTPLNLLSDEYPSYVNGTMHQDLILCRNVTIYFDRPQTQFVIDQFYEALINTGWLIVGHSEPQAAVYDAFVAQNFKRAVFYQKLVEPPKIPTYTPPQSIKEPAKPVVIAPKPKTIVPKAIVKEEPKKQEKEVDFWQQAKAAADNEQWDAALECLSKADEVDILQPHVHYLRGMIKLHQGLNGEALACLRQAVYCDPEFALALYALGDLYAQQGGQKEANRYWRRALAVLEGLDPGLYLDYADGDLTVEILQGLLKYKMTM